jgi:predicted regulator of Ras-like GTPase activity (Roadblock/LC7/MglB family)
MVTLPLILEEDIRRLNETLRAFLVRTGATTALVMDIGGFLVTSQGDASMFDLTTISALASGAYMANQTIAGLVSNKNFDSVFQQGEENSMFVSSVDEHCLLAVIFASHVKVGTVKYFAASAVRGVAQQLQVAKERAPTAGLDLSVLNQADTRNLFRKSS